MKPSALLTYRGRDVTREDVHRIRQLITEHPDLSRRALSQRLCELWDWRQPNGALRDMVCRGLMLALHRRRLIELPPVRARPPNNIVTRPAPKRIDDLDRSALRAPLADLRPLEFRLVRRTADESLVDSLVEELHYLGYTRPVGEHLKYLVLARGRALACIFFSSAARHLGPRDRFIGWSQDARRRNIRFIAYNTRYLILPWVEVPHLASHILGRIARRLALDWQRVYGHPVYFAETFVDPARFRGTCYRAANWTLLGRTTGRGKDDRTNKPNRPKKDVLGYPLLEGFRELLKRVMRARVPRIEVSVSELDKILERCRGTLDDQDHEKLSAAVDTLAWLTQELEAKRVSVDRLKKLLFGHTSEKTAEVLEPKDERAADSEESSPADDVADATAGAEDGETKTRKGHGRNAADEYTGAERIRVEHPSLKSGDACLDCDKGKVYRFAPSLVVRVRGQAPLRAEVYEIEKLRCNLCGKVFSAEAPEGIGEEKYDAESASMIALLKYGSGLPFNRIERLEWSLGIPLPAATQWGIVHDAARSIAPAYEELIRQAAQGDVLHNDDTGMKILGLMGKRWKKKQAKSKKRKRSSRSKERKGVFTSGIVSVGEGRKIALFFTGRQHAGENLRDVLRKRAEELAPPVQMCDGLSRNLPGEFEVIVANCLAHGRREFVELTSRFPKECRRVLETLREVYRLEAEARKKKLTPEERLAFHREKSRPMMVELRRWFRDELQAHRIEENSPLGAAIKYMKKHWWKMTRFYRSPGAPLDNNLCERALKKAILHRKNAYFYKTENGAHVGDEFMSLIYTAELSGVSPFDYLTELKKHAKELRENPSAWMPWSYRETLAALES